MKSKLPSDQQLITQKAHLNGWINDALNSQRKTMKVTIRDKLRLLNEELILFKNSGISFRIIRGLLRDRLGLEVSEQTLREHCQKELGFLKRGQMDSDADRNALRGTLQKHLFHSTTTTTPPPFMGTNGVDAASPETVKESAAISTERLATAVSAQITAQTQTLINQLEDY